MTLSKLVPGFLKPVLRPVYGPANRWYLRITHRPKTVADTHDYWRQPGDGSNLPQEYLEGRARSELLVRTVKQHAAGDPRILEVGCNIGRNLQYLFEAGFNKLEAIEISSNAIEILKQRFPLMARAAVIHNAPAEEVIRNLKDNSFDLVFSMAVLEHIHKQSEWIFPEMARVTGNLLITIEDEGNISWRHFPRNYKKVFESAGMKQVEERNCRDIEGLGDNFFLRVFKKP